MSEPAQSNEPQLVANRRYLLTVVVLALAVRLGAMLALPEVIFPDQSTYGALARNIIEKGKLVDDHGYRAMVAPGYPLLIAGARAVLGQSEYAYRLPQLVFGVLTVLGIFLLGTGLFGARAGLFAGLLAAVDPFSVYFENLMLSEGPALCLLVWTAWAAWRCRGKIWLSALAGGLAAACVLTRPGWMLTCLLLLLGAMFIARSQHEGRRDWQRMLLAAAVFCAVMSPWWVRNYRVLGEFVLLSTGGGQTLFEGNSENATGAPAVPETVGVRMRNIHGLDELERDRLLAADARQWIREHPGAWIRLALVKFGRTWSPVPNEAGHRKWYQMVVSAANWLVILALTLIAILKAAKRQRGLIIWCLIPAILVVFGHLFVVGSVRYRMPAWPFLDILAGVGIALIWKPGSGNERRRVQVHEADCPLR